MVAQPSPPHQTPPIHHCCLPPHRHTACDITPCSSHTPPVELGGQLRAKGRERRKEEGGKRGKKKGETRERERWQATPEQRVSSALLPRSGSGDTDCVENVLPLTSSPAQPPVRYPSPTLLNHMRRPRQSHDNHPPDQSPGGREEETELSTTASDTFLSTTAGSTPYHTPSPPGNVGRLVTEVGRRKEYQVFCQWSQLFHTYFSQWLGLNIPFSLCVVFEWMHNIVSVWVS